MHNHYSFIGGHEGPWRVTRCDAIVGEPVDAVQRLNVVNTPASQLGQRGTWVLQGFTSNVRYAERHEITQLRARQEGLNRPASTCAALMKLRASEEWKYVEREVDIRLLKVPV